MSEISQARINDAAMVAHEANRAFCLSIGDSSQPDWRSAENWQRESAMAGAEAIAKDPTITPQESHEKWTAYKIAEGWVYGEKKDLEAKTHPCLVPYDELPENDRRKDAIFGAVVRAVLGLPPLLDSIGQMLDRHITRDQHNAVVEAMESTINELDAQLAKLRAESTSTALPPSHPYPGAEPTASEGAES